MGRYALLVAASDYEDSYFEQLRSPAQDVQGLARVLRDPDIGGFEVTVLENAADHEVRRMLDEVTSDRRPDDLVLVYFSCHGLQDTHGRLHFATTTTWAQRPASTAIAASFVSECLEGTAAAGRLLLLDCCYSGAFARGFAKTSPRPLDGEISRGYVCLTACNEYELAYEGESVVIDEPRPSVFTEVVIEGLRTGAADLDRDGWVESGELHRYAFDAVRRTTRQTPSYFAAGLQAPLRVARAATGSPVRRPTPSPVLAAAGMARTPRFFAARFPPFHFAREDRATPTHLAEVMARRRDEAVALFRSEEGRSALHEWISQDVRDRFLERSILRRAPEDGDAAEAAVGTFIATFAPHLPPCYRGEEVTAGDLAGLAHRAAGGDAEARTDVTRLHRHNMLRTLGRHNCRDTSHACGPGKACAVLLAAAQRWDDLVPATLAAAEDLPRGVRPGEPAIAAQLLTMILDETALRVPHALAGAQRDMPTWWLRLILTARVPTDSPGRADARMAQLALAVLTHDAARDERDETRKQESLGRAGMPAPAPPGHPAVVAPARWTGWARRGLPALATAAIAVAAAAGLGAVIAGRWWRDPGLTAEIYSGDAGYAVPSGLAGLLVVALAAGTVTAARHLLRRRWARARRRVAATALAAVVTVVAVPGARQAWREHAHERAQRYAAAHGTVLDDRGRPILVECGAQLAAVDDDVVLAPDRRTAGGCRTVDVYFRGRRTGRLGMPRAALWTSGSRLWVTSADATAVLTAAVWLPGTGRWRLVGVTVDQPDHVLWTLDLEQTGADLKAVRRDDTVVVSGRTGIYTVNMRVGQIVGRYSCPAGHRFEGLGSPYPTGIGMYCDQREQIVDG